MVFTLVAVVGLSIMISAGCSLLESVLYSTRRLTLEAEAAGGDHAAALMMGLKLNVDRPLSAILILNTVANTAGASVAGWAAAHVWGAHSLWAFSIAFTLGILFFSEILPKTVGAVYWRKLWRRTVWPLKAMIWILAPLIALTRIVTVSITGKSGLKASVSQEEILAAARMGSAGGQISEMEHQLIRNIIGLEDIRATDIMTPRTVIQAAEGGLTAGQLGARAASWPVTRIPVFRGNLDQVIGYVLKTDVLVCGLGESDTTLAEMAKPVQFVPGSVDALSLLSRFLRSREQMFIVVDEYGGTMGLVTLEDVVESLVGSEIVDEEDVIVDMQEMARQSGRAKLDPNAEDDVE